METTPVLRAMGLAAMAVLSACGVTQTGPSSAVAARVSPSHTATATPSPTPTPRELAEMRVEQLTSEIKRLDSIDAKLATQGAYWAMRPGGGPSSFDPARRVWLVRVTGLITPAFWGGPPPQGTSTCLFMEDATTYESLGMSCAPLPGWRGLPDLSS